MRLALVLSALSCLALACGSATTAPASPANSAAAGATEQDPAHAAEAGEAELSAHPLTTEECRELIAHVVDLAVAEDAAENPELPPPTDAELAAMRDHLGAELEDRCVGRERGVYACAMQAETRAELAACDEPAD
jgi:hypothetical protein